MLRRRHQFKRNSRKSWKKIDFESHCGIISIKTLETCAMQIYHISLNEYKGYASSWKFFTNLDAAKAWVIKEIKQFADFIEIGDKDIDELIEEYNESNDKYAMILTSAEIPNLSLIGGEKP